MDDKEIILVTAKRILYFEDTRFAAWIKQKKKRLIKIDKNVRSSNPTVAPLAFVSGLGSRGHASAGILIITISIHPIALSQCPGLCMT